MIPRSHSSQFTEEDSHKYNRLCTRFGQYLKSLQSKTGQGILLNSELWISVKKGTENRDFLGTDGLHLNDTGKQVMAKGWASQMKNSQRTIQRFRKGLATTLPTLKNTDSILINNSYKH